MSNRLIYLGTTTVELKVDPVQKFQDTGKIIVLHPLDTIYACTGFQGNLFKASETIQSATK